MELVSVVVPIYNMETFLPRCIETLLSQTYDKIEIILIDDGSTDNSKIMSDEYSQKYPEKVRTFHKKNGGLSSARNEGILQAKGKYIIFPDPDDWTEPNYIERAVVLQEEYKTDLVCLGHYIEYDNKSIPVNDRIMFSCMNQQEAKRALLLPPAMNGFAWNKLYKVDVIRTYNLKFLDDVGTTEDLDFSFRYLEYCEKVCFAPEERLYHYYQRSGAATHGKFSSKKIDSIRTYEKIISKSSGDKELVKAAEDEICNIAINLIWLYKRDGCADKKSWITLRQYLKKYLRGYLKSPNNNKGRKVQAVLAYFLPNLFVKLKNKVQKK